MHLQDEPLRGTIPANLQLTLVEANNIVRDVPVQAQIRLTNYFDKVDPDGFNLMTSIRIIAAQSMISQTITDALSVHGVVSSSLHTLALLPELGSLAVRADCILENNQQKAEDARHTISFAREFIDACLSDIDKEHPNDPDRIAANAEAKRDLITLHNEIVDAVSPNRGASIPSR